MMKSGNLFQLPKTFSIAQNIKTVPVLPEWTQLAIDIKARYDLQFYDSLLLAAAETNGCTEFWSEDLNDGQMYGSVRAVNPFKNLADDFV